MRAVVIANQNDADDGFVGQRLRDLGVRTEAVSREDHDRLVSAARGADLVVLLGSDWSVYDPAHSQSVEAESQLVTDACRDGRPVLAICYGAQLAAHSLGLTVSRAERPEIGWYEVESFDERLCPAGPWFQLHFDRWEHGPGVQLLGQSATGPQGFRTQRLLAVQFHPEVRPEVARSWLEALPEHLDIDLDAIEHEGRALAGPAERACAELVDAFLSDVAGALPLPGLGTDAERP